MTRYREFLIVTDNPLLAERFEKEVWPAIDNENYKFSFACSPFSNLADFKNLENATEQIDLRNKETVDFLKNKSLILSLHCKQLFPKELVNNVRCVNIHPGFNPINRGWYPQVFAIVEDLDIGATIHEMDEKLDHGGIIAQAKIEKYAYDTSLSLYKRVVDKEIELLKSNISQILDGTYKVFYPKENGNLRLKKDFKNLCKLDLTEKLTMGEAITRLRALTHGEFKNAYFFDETGLKIYISLNVNHE